MLGVAQLLLGEALLDAGASEMLAQMIQLSGGGTIALGIYFLLFLARHESEFTQAYNKAEKMVLEVNPDTGQKELVDNSPKALKAAWYALPVGMTFIGLLAWLVA
jgi:hypothetical protein